MKYFFYYIILINILSIFLTIYDKIAARKHRFRIPENVLFGFGFFGGAIAMYVTMRAIHHKTKHNLFMIGLPIIICIYVALTFLFLDF